MRKLLTSTLVAFAVASFWTVVLPLQTYLPSQDLFDYSLRQLLPTVALLFAGAFTLLFLVQLAVGRRLRPMLQVLLIFVSVCAFLESGMLSFGLPQLDGTIIQLGKPTIRKYLDVALFGLLFIGGIMAFRFLRDWIEWITGAFLILALASVFDVQRPQIQDAFVPFETGIVKIPQDVQYSAALSTNRNVIVLVLDSTPSDEVALVMEQHPELGRAFNGFTLYRNNIGMHGSTARGLPSLATGRYLEKDETASEHRASFYGKDSFLLNYLENDYAMFVVPSTFDSFTNRRARFSKRGLGKSASSNPFLRYTKDSPYFTLLDVIVFRVIPYRKKLGFILSAMGRGMMKHPVTFDTESPEMATNGPDEKIVYDRLSHMTVKNDFKRTLHLYHTTGVHVPISYDEEGNPLAVPVESIDGIRTYMPYMIHQVGRLMQFLREKGAYDNTMIVVTTDHGIPDCSFLFEEGSKTALLMIKPFYAKDPFAISDLPSSHAKISAVLKESVQKDLSRKEIEAILRTENRKLRVKHKSDDKWWQLGRLYDTYDFYFDDDGKEISRKNLGEFTAF